MEPACSLRLSDDRAGGDRGTAGSVELRASGGDEAELLAAIQEAASLAALGHIFPPEQYPYPIDDVVARWRDFAGAVVVAERSGTPVGVAATAECWLVGLYVIPEEWGTGVADHLHDDVVERMRAAGCREARLWCLEENHRARRFYERRGWRLVEETRVVPFPPHPLDVSYALDLAAPPARMAAIEASWSSAR